MPEAWVSIEGDSIPMVDLLMQGIKLMGLGMGIVFFFLVLLVFMMQAMSWLAHRIGGDEVRREEARPGTTAAAAVDGDLIAAIGAAVYRYRARNRR